MKDKVGPVLTSTETLVHIHAICGWLLAQGGHGVGVFVKTLRHRTLLRQDDDNWELVLGCACALVGRTIPTVYRDVLETPANTGECIEWELILGEWRWMAIVKDLYYSQTFVKTV